MARDLPVGKAQQIVLNALGITGIQTWSGAEATFEDLGIIVRAQRVGRSSEPRVRRRNTAGAAANLGGDYDTWDAWDNLTDEQRAALQPFWED